MPVDVERLTAPNPSPMTLDGTNTYVVGRDPAVVIDPGPDDAGHIERVREVASGRGGIGSVLLTHDDADHLGGVALLGVDPTRPADGETVAGLTALATPGHAAEHLSFLIADGEGRSACFCGDLILGQGSTIVGPREFGGSLADYMDSLRKLERLDLSVLYPGHGPEIADPEAKIAEYLAHRQEREDRLVAALDRGERSKAALLAEVWDDVPQELRMPAGIAMEAHLEKLAEEGRLPRDLRD